LLHDAALGDQRTLDAHGNRGSGFCRRIRDCRSILVYLRSTEFIPPALTSILASFEPLSAVVLCVLLLGTSFNYVECIGAALIISNLFILSIPNDKFRAFFPRFRRAGLEN